MPCFSEREALRAKSPSGVGVLVEGFKLYCGRLSPLYTCQLYATTAIISFVGFNIFGAILIDVYFLKAKPFDFSPFGIGVFQSLHEVCFTGFGNSPCCWLLHGFESWRCLGDLRRCHRSYHLQCTAWIYCGYLAVIYIHR